MFKHNIKYTDFNGTERQEDFYFHLSLPEVTRIEAELGKPIEDYSKELVETMDLKKLLDFLEKMILSSYGKKTSDGKSFHKSKELREEFENSPAYAELFEELLTDKDLAQNFGKSVADNGKQKKNVVTPQVINNQ
jgi:hypothetical protein